jgi:uncharacterized membrane protein YhdT
MQSLKISKWFLVISILLVLSSFLAMYLMRDHSGIFDLQIASRVILGAGVLAIIGFVFSIISLIKDRKGWVVFAFYFTIIVVIPILIYTIGIASIGI